MQTTTPAGGAPATAPERERIAALPIRRRFEVVRWIMSAAGILLVLFVVDFLLSPGWKWHIVAEYLFADQVLAGVRRTLGLTVLSLAIGSLIGLLVCAARLSQYPLLRAVAFVYIWVVRALPIMVVLLFIFFLAALVPTLGLGIPGLPPLWQVDTKQVVTQFGSALLGLSLYFGGKAAEIFRGGYLAVGAGQHEAVRALGMTPWTALTRVSGPQAVRVLIPPMANEVVTMFKNTSIVTVIGYGELLTMVQKVYSQTGETIPMLAVACVWYLALTSVLMVGQIWLERRVGRGFDRRSHIKPVDAQPAEAVTA
jgi:polar amino acid transport system permease protein